MNRSPFVNPFANILRLAFADLAGKALNLVAFLYLARVLGVTTYGIVEFSQSLLLYLLFLADGGLELWGLRAVAQGRDVRELAGRIVSMRLLLAGLATTGLALLLPLLPAYPGLDGLLLLFGLTLFPQALNLRWAFVGRGQMTAAAAGSVGAQIGFALVVLLLVKSPDDVFWVPLARLLADVLTAGFFLWLFIRQRGWIRLKLPGRYDVDIMRGALVFGIGHSLALMSFNLDTLLLGFLGDANEVGWYAAAYKPVIVALALPVAYFGGLFPVLSRCYAESRAGFRQVVTRSLGLAALFALPIGVGGTFLAAPMIQSFYGADYAPAVAATQILVWSAVLVVLRGTYRHGLNAGGGQRLDLLCGAASIGVNLGLNLLLIPWLGIVGAASTAVVSEAVWLASAAWCFGRHVAMIPLFQPLIVPVLASMVMALTLWLEPPLHWTGQGLLAVITYLGVVATLTQLARAKRRNALASEQSLHEAVSPETVTSASS